MLKKTMIRMDKHVNYVTRACDSLTSIPCTRTKD